MFLCSSLQIKRFESEKWRITPFISAKIDKHEENGSHHPTVIHTSSKRAVKCRRNGGSQVILYPVVLSLFFASSANASMT